MSEDLKQEARDYSRYDSMPTEELEEILRLEAHKPTDEESDTDELFYIMGVLTERRERENKDTGKTVEEAYATFKKHYMPSDGEENIDIQTENAQTVKPKKRAIGWLRRFGAVAAVLAVIVLATVSADAFGLDLFGKVANWSKEFFHFEEDTQGTEATEPDVQDGMEFSSLQEALDKHEITQKLAPTCLPAGYILTKIDVEDSPKETAIYAKYEKDGTKLKISIRQLLGSQPDQIEKSENFLEVYSSNGIDYYLFSNNGDLQAVWTVGEFECYIAGPLTEDEMKVIIDSI